MEDINEQDNELNSYRTDIRKKSNFNKSILMVGFNNISSCNMEDKIRGMQIIVKQIQKNGLKLSPNNMYPDHFYTLLHIYLHEIHSECPNLEIINMAILILRFSPYVDISDIETKYNRNNPKLPPVHVDKLQLPFPKKVEVQSLAQPDSIQFLLNGLSNPFLTENCLSLLSMIVRSKNDQIFNVFCPKFYEFIQNNPSSHYGEIFFIYFDACLKDQTQFSYKIVEFDQILCQMMISECESNVYFSLKCANLIFNQQTNFIASFQQAYITLIQKLPEYILSNRERIIVQSLTFVSFLLQINQVTDPILLAVFHSLPLKYKKHHKFAFSFVSSNLERIYQLIPIEEVAAVIQNCFISSQFDVKINSLKLFDQVMAKASIIHLINIDHLFIFLDDPSSAGLALPFIISYIDYRVKSGDISDLMETLSLNIDQIIELTENEDQNVAKMASVLNTFYESHL